MATAKSTYDCFNDLPEVEPNGDISGPGVIAGFLGTAYLSILVLAGYYFLVFDPTRNPYQRQEGSQHGATSTITEQDGEDDWVPNPIDIWFLENVRKMRKLVHEFMHKLGRKLFPEVLRNWLQDKHDFDHPLVQQHFPETLYKALQKLFDTSQGSDHNDQDEIEIAFNECMRSICDTQLVTGVGILISAYWILDKTDSDGKGLITAYHWQIAVYLAWLSNLTHMTGLTFLRKYLARYKTERLWRTFSMTCLFLIVFISFQPLVYFNWDVDGVEGEAQPSNASSNALCYFKLSVARERMRNTGSDAKIPYSSGSSAIVSMCLLAFSFTTRMIKLSKTSSRFVRLKIRKGPSKWMKDYIDKWWPRATNAGGEEQSALVIAWNLVKHEQQPLLGWATSLRWAVIWRYLYVVSIIVLVILKMVRIMVQRTKAQHIAATVVMGALLTGRLYFDLLTSMLSEVYWAFVAGAWVSVRILKSRNSAAVDEDMFSFGQLLAVFLLVSPLITTFVALWPLRSALWKLREPRPGPGLRQVDTLPTARPSAADVHRQFTESTSSYQTPETSLIIGGACFMILWATGLFFWNMAFVNGDGLDTIVSVIFLALGQPFCCFCAYLGTTGAAERLSRDSPHRAEAEGTPEAPENDPTTTPVEEATATATATATSTSTTTEHSAEGPRPTKLRRRVTWSKVAMGFILLVEKWTLRTLITMQFVMFPVMATVGMRLGGKLKYIFMGIQGPLSLYMFTSYAPAITMLTNGTSYLLQKLAKNLRH